MDAVLFNIFLWQVPIKTEFMHLIKSKQKFNDKN
jgi:hypothetical protein